MQDTLNIPASEAGQIIGAHDGDVALLWLCLKSAPGTTVEDAARRLCRTKAEMEAALEKLQRMGLEKRQAAPVPTETETTPGPVQAEPPVIKMPPADELPQYASRDLVARSREDPRFEALVYEAKRALGHALSTTDLKKLFGLYDYLALPPEIIMMLLNYCIKTSRDGNPPSMSRIEKEGYVWANREILTLEQAEEYITNAERAREDTGRMARLLGITGRNLSPTEKKYIGAWLELGFDDELIEIALDRTVTNTGALKWGYMNSILQSWHKKGVHTPADVRDKDTPRKRGSAKKEEPRDLGRLVADLDRI